MVVAEFGEDVRSSDVSTTNAGSPAEALEPRLRTRTLIKDSDGCDTPPLRRASYSCAGAMDYNLESQRKAVEPRLKTRTLITDSDGCDTQPFGKGSYVSAGAMENNLQNPRQAVEPGTRAGAWAIPSDNQQAGRSSDGPNLRELIAEAKKRRLGVDSSGPNPDPRSLKRSALSDYPPRRLGEHQKNMSSDPNSEPGMLKRSTESCPPRIGLSESLNNVSAVRKSNETPKFPGKKLVVPDLKRKQKQDPGLTPSVSFFKKKKSLMDLELALDTERALLLQNLDPGFSSYEIETMLTEVLNVSCEARMQPPKDFSCYTSGEALVLFQSRGDAEGALWKLTENVLVWSKDERPVVASLAPKHRHEKDCFHGFMNPGKDDLPNGESHRPGGASSHCSQPNTLIFEMGMEWRLLQEQQTEAWNIAAQEQQVEASNIAAQLNDS